MSNIFGGSVIQLPQVFFTIADPDAVKVENESSTYGISTLCALEHFDEAFGKETTTKSILAKGCKDVARTQKSGVIVTFTLAVLAAAAFISSMVLIFLVSVPLTSWLIIGLLTLTTALLVTLVVTIPLVFMLADSQKYQAIQESLAHLADNIKNDFRLKQDSLGDVEPFQFKQTISHLAQITNKDGETVEEDCAVSVLPSYKYKVVSSMKPATLDVTSEENIYRVTLQSKEEVRLAAEEVRLAAENRAAEEVRLAAEETDRLQDASETNSSASLEEE